MINTKFKQIDYINKYNKENYTIFSVRIKKEQANKLNELLKKRNLTKAQFLRNAIEDLKRKGE